VRTEVILPARKSNGKLAGEGDFMDYDIDAFEEALEKIEAGLRRLAATDMEAFNQALADIEMLLIQRGVIAATSHALPRPGYVTTRELRAQLCA
jgi:hypothetical protein